jgi:2'-hydroxyisoflavone reductase
MPSRRTLLKLAAAVMAQAALARAANAVAPAAKPLDILILGGTGFLGPHQVEYALARGHRLTLFNRGKRAPGLYGGRVEELLGDRDAKVGAGLGALHGERRWDVVIDNSGYVPRHVRDSIELLKARCKRYVYVSTLSVYDPAGRTTFDESSPLYAAPADGSEQVTGESYGPLKAECDRIAQTLGEQVTIVRPTYVVGPGDTTDRFTYWVERVARGGEVLGPPDPKIELQVVDVRDMCPWIVDLAERDQAGIYNACGPAEPVSFEQILRELAKIAPQPVNFRWSSYPVLQKLGIELPLVDPQDTPGAVSVHFSNAAAQAAGLRFRPLADTAAATLKWWNEQPEERRAKPRGWPTTEQEREGLRLLADA